MINIDLMVTTASGVPVRVRRYGASPPDGRNGRWLAIGMFDGVHEGHRAVLDLGRQAARECGAAFGAVVFDPHPRSIVGAGVAPVRIQTSLQRAQALVEQGATEIFEIHFDLNLSRLSPTEFCRLLTDELAPRGVSVGAGFRFGHRQAGDLRTLAELGRDLNFDVRAVRDVELSGGRVSSTTIRQHIAAGDVCAANRLLGRPLQLEGVIAQGGVYIAPGLPAQIPLVQTCPLPAGAYVAQIKGAASDDRYAGLLTVAASDEGPAVTFTCHGAGGGGRVAKTVLIEVLQSVEGGLGVLA